MSPERSGQCKGGPAFVCIIPFPQVRCLKEAMNDSVAGHQICACMHTRRMKYTSYLLVYETV